ncbi:transcriptional regulator [Lactobacillus phage JNU_P1]|nr:transcriptional regulator [Lactobacillus phage JNU_P1]
MFNLVERRLKELPEVIKDDAYKVLRSTIESRGLKQNYVAKRIGITPNYLASILNGRRRLNANIAIRASQVLEIPLDIFLRKN